MSGGLPGATSGATVGATVGVTYLCKKRNDNQAVKCQVRQVWVTVFYSKYCGSNYTIQVLIPSNSMGLETKQDWSSLVRQGRSCKIRTVAELDVIAPICNSHSRCKDRHYY